MASPVLSLPRPFGSAAGDLEIDFGSADRPAQVTALLAACDPGADAAAWWRRPVGERIAALLALEQRTTGREAITLTLRCGRAGCGARYEIELPYAALPTSTDAPTVAIEREDGATVVLRRPTGDDLRAWHLQPPASHAEMLARLAVDGQADAGAALRSAEALAAADPLLDFGVACVCPECGESTEREVDLEGIALQRLAARQHAVLREVHALASRYGWTEAEIFAVAAPRRARYLDLIEGGDA